MSKKCVLQYIYPSFFFPHKFFKEKYFDRDGIHLNQDGNRWFYNNIKQALRFSLSNWIATYSTNDVDLR